MIECVRSAVMGFKLLLKLFTIRWEEAHCRGHKLSVNHSLKPWGRSETRANLCPCRISPDPGEWVPRNTGLEWCVFIREVSQLWDMELLMDVTSLAWKCSWLATEFNVWAGAGLQNPIQTTLLPLFISWMLKLFCIICFVSQFIYLVLLKDSVTTHQHQSVIITPNILYKTPQVFQYMFQ